MQKLIETDWLSFLHFVQNHQPPLVAGREEITDTEHIYTHVNPATGEVCAVQEAPRDLHGNDDYANRVCYVLGPASVEPSLRLLP